MLRKTLLLTLLIIFTIAGCGPAPYSPECSIASQSVKVRNNGITAIDGLCRKIVLDVIPAKVVSLAPSNTEILFAIGAGSQVVGRDQLSDYPEAAKAVTDIGSAFEALNTELIVSLKPDLILAAEINTADQIKALEDLGLTVYYLKNPTTLEELYTNLEIVAQLTGHQADATQLIDDLKARVAAVDEKIATVTEKPTAFYELDATDPAKPYTVGKGTFITLLIERAGAQNIAGDLDEYPQLSLEQVVAADPDFIILGDSAYGITPESVAARPGWDGLSAVTNNQVFPFDDNLVSRPGPRLVDGLEALAKVLHPELFQ